MPADVQPVHSEEDLMAIKQWLKKQTHLPQTIDDRFLLRFLHSCHHSLERAKRTIDLCYSIRNNAPEIFNDRDPLSPTIQQVFKATDMIPLPVTTPENYKVFIYRLADYDPDQFIFNACVKTFLMVSDVRLVTEETFPTGEVPIFDMAGLSLKHLTRIVFPTLKKYMVYTQEAHPVRLKQIHVINSSSFVDKVTALVRPLMKSEVFAMLHFHTDGSETLFKYVPKEILPSDYGGNAPSVAELKKEWIQKVEAHRNYFLNESNWKVNELKRPAGSRQHDSAKLLGMEGTFRSLAID